MPKATQEPIEKNILNDPNGTVDKMQKELEQQAIANQPSEGWEPKAELEWSQRYFELWAKIVTSSVPGAANTMDDFIRSLLATARREERKELREKIEGMDFMSLSTIPELLGKRLVDLDEVFKLLTQKKG